MTKVNYRWDEFTGEDLSILITDELVTVPASSPYYVALAEIPQEGSVQVLTSGGGSSVVALEDTWVDQGAPSTNHANDTFLAAGRDNAGSGSWVYRAYLKFDLSALPANASMAKVRMYREFGHSAPTFQMRRVLGAWSASSLAWNNQPAIGTVPESAVNVNQYPQFYEFDITALYNAWKSGALANNGVVLTGDEIATDTSSNWSSTNAGSNRPTLIVAGAGVALQNVAQRTVPGPGQVAVAYPTGRLRFHPSAAGAQFKCTYYGTGGAVDANDP